MAFVSESGDFSLLIEVLKLEGKLVALQRASGLTLLEPKVYTDKPTPKLDHTLSATSTDCPDGSCTTEAMDTQHDSEDDDEEASSESDDDE